jgi:hypothetical protein
MQRRTTRGFHRTMFGLRPRSIGISISLTPISGCVAITPRRSRPEQSARTHGRVSRCKTTGLEPLTAFVLRVGRHGLNDKTTMAARPAEPPQRRTPSDTAREARHDGHLDARLHRAAQDNRRTVPRGGEARAQEEGEDELASPFLAALLAVSWLLSSNACTRPQRSLAAR